MFFAADYASSNKAGADQASSKQPVVGLIEPKPTGLLGVGGSSDSVASEGVAAKARRFLDGRGSRGAGARAGPQREVSELQDGSVSLVSRFRGRVFVSSLYLSTFHV